MSNDLENYKRVEERHRRASRSEAENMPANDLLGKIDDIGSLAEECLSDVETICKLAEYAAESPTGALDAETMVNAFKIIRASCMGIGEAIYNERRDLGCDTSLNEQYWFRSEARKLEKKT